MSDKMMEAWRARQIAKYHSEVGAPENWGDAYKEAFIDGYEAAIAELEQRAEQPKPEPVAFATIDRQRLDGSWDMVARFTAPAGDPPDYLPAKRLAVYLAPPAIPEGYALGEFDAAVAAELPRVSHVQYDSHEICKHFAGKVRERLIAAKVQQQ